MVTTNVHHLSKKVGLAVLCATACVAAQSISRMPPHYPASPGEYISKWDPFVLRSLTGLRQPIPLANGRQIARDSTGNWFVLVERDRRGLVLGCGAGPQIQGSDLALVELVGRGQEAIFEGRGNVTGGSMVIDGNDRLHVIWNAPSGLMYATASLRGAGLEKLRDKTWWEPARLLVEAPCHPGDILLDSVGHVAVCYSRNDTVYYLPIGTGKAEPAGGVGAGMAALSGLSAEEEDTPSDDQVATPTKSEAVSGSRRAERECQEAIMDLAPDGSVYVAFRRDHDIWVSHRTRDGVWQPAECAARALSFHGVPQPARHPSLIVAGGRPLVCFQYGGGNTEVLGTGDYVRQRERVGSSVGFATKTERGWRTGGLATAEEIIVNRRGIWDKMNSGRVFPMVEQMGRPVLLRDRHGVAWALWQNTTRRWAYCARWMGEEFGQVQECRGPFSAPGAAVSAEKLMPATATDAGVLFLAANRVIFDRLRVPTLSPNEAREILFLDSLEIGETSGVDFVLNRMTKSAENPVLSPGHIIRSFQKHGSTYVMSYSYQTSDQDREWKSGLAVSPDGVRWQKVERLPEALPPPERLYPFHGTVSEQAVDPSSGDPVVRGYFDNPDRTDPAKRFMRMIKCGEVGWARGSYCVQYSPDGKDWTEGPETSVFNAIREGGLPSLWDPLDVPDRRIKAYGRVYTANARSCGVMWSSDLLHWGGVEHFLDPDHPYGTPPAVTPVGPLRAQVFLDASAGRGEDQLYSCGVSIVEGLYLCGYLPCTFDLRRDFALAVSRDGLNFTRVKNGERTLTAGPLGAWDSYGVMNKWLQRDGDTIRLYYVGTGHLGQPGRLGLATIRVNGWTFYTPRSADYPGTVTTIPIQAPAGLSRGLTLNVEGAGASAGAVTVEVLDAATRQPIKGFGVAECISPSSDGLAVPVAWKSGKMLPSGKDIRLRFHLRGRGVRLYSFGFRTAE